jgi:dihydroorotate dehydrogenase
VTRLHPHADFFVVNLSSPNTVGLRGMLLDRRLAADLLAPLKRELELLNKASSRPRTTPILLKLPPEDPERIPWKYDALELILRPVLDERACDGFVAVNTSTVLTQQLLGLDAGGVSGQPLLPIAIDSVKLLRSIVGPQPLIIGCGGVVKPADALALAAAGAELVELYSGMIYAGPGLPARCAAEMKRNSSRATNR